MSSRIVLILLLFSIFNCKEKPKVTFTPHPIITRDLEGIRQRGYMETILDNNSLSYFIYKGHPMGYEYELVKHFASYLKVELKDQSNLRSRRSDR